MTIRVRWLNQLFDVQRLNRLLEPVNRLPYTDDAPNVGGQLKPGTAWRWWSAGHRARGGCLD